MTTFEFYKTLRKEVLEQISGTQNSNGYLYWDNTTPNWVTKRNLEELLNRYIQAAQNFGIYIVTRYATCSNEDHTNYPTTNRYGVEIPYLDEKYIWGDDQLYQGDRISICPCSANNKPYKSWVIDDIVYAIESDMNTCEKIASILTDISSAIENARDKKPRSSIREHLLRAVIKINDAILPQSIDEYITLKETDNKRLSSY